MRAPPTGTVTFLFTDIEGSTRLWEEHPEAMRVALARHDAVLREIIEAQGGHVFKTLGDAFHAAFADAASAVTASAEIQRALQAEPWEIPGGLAVRMALHTGTAEAREDDYFGPPLNRAARLLSAGHGGQILLSEATRALVESSLPEGLSLRDLGSHRLRDLARPEHIFQLVVAGLRSEFPSLRTLDVMPNNLPRQLTSFIGRTRELAEIKARVADTPLLTLTGVGGAGKTRLALQVAADLVESFPDGVWLIELTPLSDPALVLQTVARTLGVREEQRPLLHTLLDHLTPKAPLLVLDNCEHVLAATAELAQTLLRSCPRLRILATSQEPLGVAGEVTYHVPSLSMPDVNRLPPPDRLTEFESIGLFVDRAAVSRPGFALTAANARAVAQICARLDGIPLAIELAAARVKVLSVEEIAARLDDRFRLLASGSRTAPPRHQTLRAALDWSHDLLADEERMLLRRLSVFMGGWTLPAAEAVCAGDGCEASAVLDVLTRLVDRSLVSVGGPIGNETWYRLLETVRLYAREKLDASGEAETVQRRHRDWYLQFAEQAERELQGPALQAWLERLEAEHDNIRAALKWCQTAEPDPEYGLRLAGAVWHFWEVRGYLSEGREWLESALAKGTQTLTTSRVKALNGAGILALIQGDFPRAAAVGEEALELSRRLGDKRGLASCLNILGLNACRLEKYDQAAQLGEESLALNREVGDRWGVAGARLTLGLVARGQRDFGRAATLLQESVEQFRQLGDKWASTVTLNNLGLVLREMGDYQRAQTVLEETLALFRDLGDRWGIAFSLANLGIVAWDRQEYARAAALFAESLPLRRELQDRRGISTSLTGLAVVAVKLGQLERAVVLLGAAEALREALALPPAPFIRETYSRHVATAREGLGEAAFTAAWQRGRAMTTDQAIEFALVAPDDHNESVR
ncbi:MAG: tetratricopeptide repeat protein [Armatimonadota bacterium]|nr:tetratricopeptide repeat protein [Armatimonadota bacterium]MDR7450904.1 tetratricopeptide repeat protein [Armatimonadota bacterium]MDR7465826.1 tetratricopeptide repeat protein [Armatimonadota bacterium]MDR7493734.1 tetratricopeptide repeat protein [Armatimonadota bacterium]MDR7498340.1 tetratricopeptide repeat protein [Armatimonadota bacterium]